METGEEHSNYRRDDREEVRELFSEIIGSGGKRRRRLKICPVLFLLFFIFSSIFYATHELSPISAQEAVVLKVLVDRAARDIRQPPDAIWKKISDATGAADPVTLDQWHYPRAIEIVTDEIDRSSLAAPPMK